MALDPAGTLLVSEPARGRVLALPDENGDGKADSIQTVVDGLDQPHGLAFRDGALYVAENGRVQRFRYDPATLKATQPTVIVPGLPAGGGHWTRTVVFGPDGAHVRLGGLLLQRVPRERQAPRRGAALQRRRLGRAHLRLRPPQRGGPGVPAGHRRALGHRERARLARRRRAARDDHRGARRRLLRLARLPDGGRQGDPRRSLREGRALRPRDAAHRGDPGALGALGLAFYTGTQFPAEYRGSLFVAYRGSWNRTVPTGYKVVRVRFRDGKPAGVEDFATGWLEGASAWGRPVDLIVGRDGALYLSDQGAGRIYRISHRT